MKDDMLPHDKVHDGLDIKKFHSFRSFAAEIRL